MNRKQVTGKRSQEKHHVHFEDTKSDSLTTASTDFIEEGINDPVLHLRKAIEKSREMKELSKQKNEEVEKEFASIKERLNDSTEYLQKITKNLENFKFSYQKNMMEINKNVAMDNFKKYSAEDMKKNMEDMRKKIAEVQYKVKAKREQEEKVKRNYKQTVDILLSAFEKIDSGDYDSAKNLVDNMDFH